MLPTAEEAMRELRIAEEMNPGPWVKHSINTGIAARKIAEKIPSMDPEKAYIVGLLHDIGRRVGVVDICFVTVSCTFFSASAPSTICSLYILTSSMTKRATKRSATWSAGMKPPGSA